MVELFTLKFTDMNIETGFVFRVYETLNHGWKTKSDFLKSVKGKGDPTSNGYKYNRCENQVTTIVEACDFCGNSITEKTK